MSSNSRFFSLDVLRGLTVIGMILVNTMGIGNPPRQLVHCPWDGCRIADLIYPFFLYIVGAAVFFSMRKTQWKLSPGITVRILRRGVLIALIGFVLNIFPFTREPSTWRFFGVLQRIAFVYVATCFLAFSLKKTRWLLLVSAAGLAGYAVGMRCCGLGLADNAVLSIDRWLAGESHLFRGYGIPFDPEGALSSLPAVVNGLLGFVAARGMLSARENGREFALRNFAGGVGLLAAGWLLSFYVPFNKPLWSSSFVLWSCGWATVLWAVLSWITDTHGFTRWALVPVVYGTNALFTYVLSELIILSDWLLVRFTVDGCEMNMAVWLDCVAGQYLPGPLRSLLWGVVVLTLCGIVAAVLYRRKIFVKL